MLEVTCRTPASKIIGTRARWQQCEQGTEKRLVLAILPADYPNFV